MKTFACGDIVVECDAEFVCEDEDDLLVQVATHAAYEHGMRELTREGSGPGPGGWLVRSTSIPVPSQPGSREAAVAWSHRLDGALSGAGVRVHFQPIVDVVRGTVVGYEALARFPGLPVRGPEQWFAAARDQGVGARLEALTLRAALARRSSLPRNTFLSVNLSPDVLESPPVREVLDREGSLGGLVVELTEHAQVDSYRELEPVLRELRDRGALIALDDAGSGYAGLAHLLGVRPDLIKLDRGLVCGINRSEPKRLLVEMLGALAGRLDAWLLAEGVETSEELDTIAYLGVPLVQGFQLGRPGEAWIEMDPDVAHQLAGSERRRHDASVRGLLERVAVVGDGVSTAESFASDAVDLVVTVDHGSRPLRVEYRGGVVTSAAECLRVNLDTPVVDATQRAVARPLSTRFSPLLGIDNAGRFVGVVRMERLVDALTVLATGPERLAGAEQDRVVPRAGAGSDIRPH